MKILHLCLSGPFNDDWGYQENLIPKYNVKDGHDVTVITSTQVNSKKFVGYEYVEPSTYQSNDGFKVIRIPFIKTKMKSFAEKLRVYQGLYNKILLEKPDFIFMHGFNYLSITDVIKFVKQNPSVKLVVDMHASYDNSALNLVSKYLLHKIIWKTVVSHIMPYVDRVFAIAPACKNFAVEMYGISKDKIDYLYLGADTEKLDFVRKDEISLRIRDELNLKNDDFVLITGGKLSKGKNIELLLKSLKKIHSSKLKLVIFGDFSDDIKHEINSLINEDERVNYIGWINGGDVYDYYLASDAAIFPGTKSALWEQAICSGIPLICSHWNGMEYVDVGGNVIFIDGVDEEKIIQNIILLMEDNKIYSNMKQIAETKGYETFSYERISRQAIACVCKD